MILTTEREKAAKRHRARLLVAVALHNAKERGIPPEEARAIQSDRSFQCWKDADALIARLVPGGSA